MFASNRISNRIMRGIRTMSRSRYILFISVIIVGLISLLSAASAFAQSRRTLMDEPTTEASKKQSTDEATKATTDKGQSPKESTSSIVGSGLGQPSNQTAKSQWPQQSQGTFDLLYKPLGATLLVCALAIGLLTI